MGIFILLIIILGFIAGALRKELVLTLVAAVFLAAWAYCLVMPLVLSFIHHRRGWTITARISPREIAVGDETLLTFPPAEKFFRIPGVLIRYRVNLTTLDDRRLLHDCDPDFLQNRTDTFTVHDRGAYYSAYDELAIFDVLGFFRCSFRIPQDLSPRLLAGPGAAEEALPVTVRSGGTEHHSESQYQRTDNLIDHRPYVPGDDPRRINWKLYSHDGELFVREGEREPPPHSHLLILVDTQFDPALYTREQARRAVDLLCESALAAALSYADEGMDIAVGYSAATAAKTHSLTPAVLLAYPAAISLLSPAEFSRTPGDEDRGVLILALPRTTAGESSALDGFLRTQAQNQMTELVFICKADDNDLHRRESLAEAAGACAALYGRKGGVTAKHYAF
ncbi:MAG: DUF58 domain-containing protein [Treponema sp.]|jgi:hypothetical protein|nr:DUF58 domain-containing protein [Treponema sp.]